MKTLNLSALADYFEDEHRLVEVRYVFSVLDDDEKEKIYCEYVVGNLARHEHFLRSIIDRATRGYFEYVREINPEFLFIEQNIFVDEKEGESNA